MPKMTKAEAMALLKNKKVYVRNMSREIQEKLFEIGFEWSNGEKNVLYENNPYLFLENNGKLLTSTDNSEFYTATPEMQEITPEKIIDIDLIYDAVKTFEDYDKIAMENEVWPKEHHLIFPALGITGEAGEVAEKVKKILRDKGGKIDDTDELEIVKELGDVLWYLTAMAHDLGYTLQEVAEENIQKIRSRRERDKIHGNGDNR